MTEFGEGYRGDEARRVVWGGPRLEGGFERCAKQLLLVLGAQEQFHQEDRPSSQEAGAQRNNFSNEGPGGQKQGQGSMREDSQGTKRLRGREEREEGGRQGTWFGQKARIHICILTW